MTHTGWNLSGNDPTSVDVRPVSSFAFLALILLLATQSQAADKPAGPAPVASSPARLTDDLQVGTKVREALVKDAELSRLNLSVHVSGGTASLSGPVPSLDLKQRAIRIVKRVEGVYMVRGDGLYVSPSVRRTKPSLVLLDDDRPTQTRSASPGATQMNTTSAPLPDPSSRSPAMDSNSSPDRGVTLLAPEAVASPLRTREPACLTANPRPASAVAALAPAVENLRRSKPRFQQIRILVRDSTVYIYPGNTSGEDVMAFAQAVRRLEGVQHVIVGSEPR